jgi:hypothetical protein
MMYGKNIISRRVAKTRPRAVRRYIAAYGTRGCANLLGLTGKQVRRYARAMRGDDMATYGCVFGGGA